MFIATALYRQITAEVLGVEQNICLTNNQRLGFFPVFETREQANKFAENMLIAQGIEGKQMIDIPNSGFIKSTQHLPDPNKYVVIKLEPLYEGDMDIYHINFRTPCTCKRSFTGECKDLVWHTHFNFYEPFEWCYINFQE